MNHIGENIKRIRLEKNMTIAQVANEHISAGMISLIENGKTQPSVERLQHIANNLSVGIGELLGRFSREELREKIDQFQKKIKTKDGKVIRLAIEELEQLFPYLDDHYEAAKIHELYAHTTYSLFVNFYDEYKQLNNKDWQAHAEIAIDLYKHLQMEWRVLGMYAFLANVQLLGANYGEAIAIIDQTIDESLAEENKESQTAYINLLYIKVIALLSQGKRELAFNVLDEAILYMKEKLVMNRFYELHNVKALLLYDDYQFVEARETAKIAKKFVELIDNKLLWFEMQFSHIHFNEFFEKEIKKALELIAETEDKLGDTSLELPDDRIEQADVYLKDAKARCLTQLKQFEEAARLFEQYHFTEDRNITLSYADLSIREISKSYLARCYFHLGKEEEARELAQYAVNKLSRFPHTAYYPFAREILREVSMGQ